MNSIINSIQNNLCFFCQIPLTFRIKGGRCYKCLKYFFGTVNLDPKRRKVIIYYDDFKIELIIENNIYDSFVIHINLNNESLYDYFIEDTVYSVYNIKEQTWKYYQDINIIEFIDNYFNNLSHNFRNIKLELLLK